MKHNSIEKERAMFIAEDIPPKFWERAQNLNKEIVALETEIRLFQKDCVHAFEKIMHYDPKYSPRLDGIGTGAKVIREFFCSTCHIIKPIRFPWQECWKCGGKMKHDHTEQFGMDRAHIYKCENCGHKHDTT